MVVAALEVAGPVVSVDASLTSQLDEEVRLSALLIGF